MRLGDSFISEFILCLQHVTLMCHYYITTGYSNLRKFHARFQLIFIALHEKDFPVVPDIWTPLTRAVLRRFVTYDLISESNFMHMIRQIEIIGSETHTMGFSRVKLCVDIIHNRIFLSLEMF